VYALIPAPDDPSQWSDWREQLHQWRNSTRQLLNYDDTLYSQPEFAWIPSTFTVAFVMMYDLLFYDGEYQLDEFLEHGLQEFGGYDALLLWHAYPRIGFDDRNQFDFYRQMPDGLQGIRRLVDKCHERDIRVYVNYNPWDIGTRRESVSDVDALVELVRATDVDAIFLDTMSNSIEGLRERLDEIRPGVTLESEMLTPMEHLSTHTSSWAQGINEAPGVLRNKWFERRHMQHRIRRWNHDHTPELHTAWMNGAGIVVWENVFGSLIPWSERDKSILRAMIDIQRRFAMLFCGEGWTPLVPTLHPDIHASLWEDENTQLWTLINHSEQAISGSVLQVSHTEGFHYFNLISGQAISPIIENGDATITINLLPRGIGAVVAIEDIPIDWDDFLSHQTRINSRANFDSTSPPVTETIHIPKSTAQYHEAQIPKGMIAIPEHEFEMTVHFRIRECGFYHIPNTGYPDLHFRNLHHPWSLTRSVNLNPYAIDETPVTNRQFAEFIRRSGYVPQSSENFLYHWQGGSPPLGMEDHPVVYVSLEDARAYAQWAGKRLPTEEEWQHAAQGIDNLRYPWGDEWKSDACNHGQRSKTTLVKNFSNGQSPFGCYDMCGNVWEWTESERTDGRTRHVMLKGGSFYQAEGTVWYADGGAQTNDFTAKFLLIYPGLDRCATIGFRCAVDIETIQK
jgi:formylglycine-generating enzyme required for sulfatase activity